MDNAFGKKSRTVICTSISFNTSELRKKYILYDCYKTCSSAVQIKRQRRACPPMSFNSFRFDLQIQLRWGLMAGIASWIICFDREGGLGEKHSLSSVWHRLLDTTAAVQYKTTEIMITGSQVSKLETNTETKRRGMYGEASLVRLPVRMLDLCVLLWMLNTSVLQGNHPTERNGSATDPYKHRTKIIW